MTHSLVVGDLVAFHLRLHGHHLTAHTAAAAGLALASAIAFAVAIVAQQRAAERVPDEHAKGLRLLRELVRSRQWLAGTISNTLGYVLQGAALAYGSLLVVQPLLVTSLLFALPLGAMLAHEKLPASVWAWAVSLAVSLAVFIVVGSPNHGASHGAARDWVVAACVLGPLVAIALVAAGRARNLTRAVALAVAVGLLGGVLAVLTKAVVASLRHGGLHVFTSWELYGLIAVGLGGAYLQQLCFQAGSLQASWPIITVLEPAVAAVLGVTMLHEVLRTGGARTIFLAVAILVMIASTASLAVLRASFERGQLEAAHRAHELRHAGPAAGAQATPAPVTSEPAASAPGAGSHQAGTPGTHQVRPQGTNEIDDPGSST